MKAAAKRQIEFEKLQERKIYKERQEEGDLWTDKETFVTTAYRKKMEERLLLEEDERRQEQIESLLDVRKQKDLSGFYANMLKMKSGEFVIEEESEKEKKLLLEIKTAPNKKEKNYRHKQDESDEEVEEEEVADHETQQTETQDDSTVGDEEPQSKKTKLEVEEAVIKVEPVDEVEVKAPKLTMEEKRELLFKKRTVGSKFDDELRDYFIRKSTILALKSYIERE